MKACFHCLIWISYTCKLVLVPGEQVWSGGRVSVLWPGEQTWKGQCWRVLWSRRRLHKGHAYVLSLLGIQQKYMNVSGGL